MASIGITPLTWAALYRRTPIKDLTLKIYVNSLYLCLKIKEKSQCPKDTQSKAMQIWRLEKLEPWWSFVNIQHIWSGAC